jgi:hypothetical protein
MAPRAWHSIFRSATLFYRQGDFAFAEKRQWYSAVRRRPRELQFSAHHRLLSILSCCPSSFIPRYLYRSRRQWCPKPVSVPAPTSREGCAGIASQLGTF